MELYQSNLELRETAGTKARPIIAELSVRQGVTLMDITYLFDGIGNRMCSMTD